MPLLTTALLLARLISPAQFDLDLSIRAEVDGKVVYERKVQPSLETLMKWAARDEERTRFYAAEISIMLD